MPTAWVFLDWSLPGSFGKTEAVAADCLGGSSRVRVRVRAPVRARGRVCVCSFACACACARASVRARVRVRVRGRACVRVRVRACACVCARACACARVRVRVCVGASRRDDPPRLGRALLGHAGMLNTFTTVGLGLGRQRILRVAQLEKLFGRVMDFWKISILRTCAMMEQEKGCFQIIQIGETMHETQPLASAFVRMRRAVNSISDGSAQQME